MVARVITAEYVFFVRIIHNRLKILVDNYEDLKNVDYNLLVIMRVYSIIWKLARNIGLMFDWSMAGLIFVTFVLEFCNCALVSSELGKMGFKLMHLGTLIIIGNIEYVCFKCLEVNRMVSKNDFSKIYFSLFLKVIFIVTRTRDS